MIISVIIPTHNEERNIFSLIRSLQRHGNDLTREIIVVDGMSTDQTVQVARNAGARVLETRVKKRSSQMNLGAREARGDILYFVHADVIIEPDYFNDILESVSAGFKAGCYRCRFASNHLLLRINAFFTRFTPLWCRGGDQTLFVTKGLFEKLEGFREDFILMEDYDLIQKIQGNSAFRILPKDIVVSARKYSTNSYLGVQFANFLVFSLYFWGASQPTLVRVYRKLIRY